MRRSRTTLSLGFGLCVLVCCGDSNKPNEGAALDDGAVLATRGSLLVTRREVEAEAGAPGTGQGRRQVAQAILRRKALAEEARRRGLHRKFELRRRIDEVLVRALADEVEKELSTTVSVSGTEIDTHTRLAPETPFVEAVCLPADTKKQANRLATDLAQKRSRLEAALVDRENVIRLGTFSSRSQALPRAVVDAAFAAEPKGVGGVAELRGKWCVVVPVRRVSVPATGTPESCDGVRRTLLRRKLARARAAALDAIVDREPIEFVNERSN
jgi:hypothetical protein